MQNTLGDNTIQHIQTIGIGKQDKQDKVYRELTKDGKFSNKSSWHIIRDKKPINRNLNQEWNPNIPLNISFFVWKFWKGKLPIDEVIERFGIRRNSTSKCCTIPRSESIQHVFMHGEAAQKLGITLEGHWESEDTQEPFDTCFMNGGIRSPRTRCILWFHNQSTFLFFGEIWKQIQEQEKLQQIYDGSSHFLENTKCC